jgi:hypothetical protein
MMHIVSTQKCFIIVLPSTISLYANRGFSAPDKIKRQESISMDLQESCIMIVVKIKVQLRLSWISFESISRI